LFNWLGQDLTGWRCVDAFAGTGVLGFEAASRGAKEVCLVEHDAALVTRLKLIQAQLKTQVVDVVRGDGIAALRRFAPGSVDMVFLDPPFDSAQFESALQAAGQAVAATGWVYLEAPVRWSDAQLLSFGLQVRRYLKAGAVHAHLLNRSGERVDNGATSTDLEN
jgi:16S rRNA (guanine(966)-N(2))-methyltransferase RsmD